MGLRLDPTQDMTEVELAGGHMTQVVRVGNTVRRTAGPWTETTHAFIRHLRSHGFERVPEPLGLDDKGREVISLLPGAIADYPLPDFAWSDETLVAVARCLRNFHDASVGFVAPPDGCWQWPTHKPDEVICHNDFAPYNLLFEDGRLTGVIDLDLASPGPRVLDLAYTVYRFVPLTDPANPDAPFHGVEAQLDRLVKFCDAYREPAADLSTAVAIEPTAVSPVLTSSAITPTEALRYATLKLQELVAFIEHGAGSGDTAQLAVLTRGDVHIYCRDIEHIKRLLAIERLRD